MTLHAGFRFFLKCLSFRLSCAVLRLDTEDEDIIVSLSIPIFVVDCFVSVWTERKQKHESSIHVI